MTMGHMKKVRLDADIKEHCNLQCNKALQSQINEEINELKNF